MFRNSRPVLLLVGLILLLVGLAILIGGFFPHAEAVGGLIGGAGAATLVTELISTIDRTRVAADAATLKLTLKRMEAASIFAQFRSAAELGVVATECLFDSEYPSRAKISRFGELCDALDIADRFAQSIPAAGEGRELEGIELYKQIRHALVDRHGESVAGAFAFVYTGGIVVGGSGTPDGTAAEKLKNTLFDLPDNWLRDLVSRLLDEWVHGDRSTSELRVQLDLVNFWLANYGSRRPEILEAEARLRRIPVVPKPAP